MSLSVPERIAQCAEHFAKHNVHGYSQPNRGTGSAETITLSDGSKVSVTNSDVDCSEMVRQCVNGGLGRKAIAYMWTGNEDEQLRAQGFVRMGYSASKVQRGDVLWVSGHTGVALGNGEQADAHGDEYGGITGPNRGDQTGHEVEVRSLRSWTYIYRYAKGGSAEPSVVAASFKVTAGTERNVRSTPSTVSSTTITGRLNPGESVVCRGLVYADGLAWGVYDNYSGKTRYIALQGQVTVS
jgi:hypothetical protein